MTMWRRRLIASSLLLYLPLQATQANPNHLEPIPPRYSFDIEGYRQAVFTSLIGGYGGSLWMIERPSFSKEYAVMLRHDEQDDPNGARPGERSTAQQGQWFIEYVAPREMIWRSKSIDDVHWELDIRPTKDVERHRAYITEDFAKALQEAWRTTLQLTRYGEHRMHGLDGTTLEFCYGDLFGETWSPKTGLPAMLADLGRRLSSIAQSDEQNRASLLAETESLARRIAKEAEAEQIRLFGKKLSYITWASILNRDGRGSQTREAR